MKIIKIAYLIFSVPFVIYCQNNYSLNFDGNSYVDLGTSISLGTSSEISISAWVKSNDNEDYRAVLTRWSNYGANNDIFWFGLASNGRIHFNYRSSSHFSNENAYSNDNSWYHIAVIKINSDIYFYVNGQEVGTSTDDISFFNDDSSIPLLIGAKNTGQNAPTFEGNASYDYFNGWIDDIQFWSKGLSSTEIQYYMDCPPETSDSDLKGYWNFNQSPEELIVVDNSNSSISGVLNGPSFSTTLPTQDCSENSSNDDNLNNIIGDLNCDEAVNQLDVLILSNLILGIGNSPEELALLYPCLNQNLNNISTENLQNLQNVINEFYQLDNDSSIIENITKNKIKSLIYTTDGF